MPVTYKQWINLWSADKENSRGKSFLNKIIIFATSIGVLWPTWKKRKFGTVILFVYLADQHFSPRSSEENHIASFPDPTLEPLIWDLNHRPLTIFKLNIKTINHLYYNLRLNSLTSQQPMIFQMVKCPDQSVIVIYLFHCNGPLYFKITGYSVSFLFLFPCAQLQSIFFKENVDH